MDRYGRCLNGDALLRGADFHFEIHADAIANRQDDICSFGFLEASDFSANGVASNLKPGSYILALSVGGERG